jgi:V8-like Glu-specific endopeptidase
VCLRTLATRVLVRAIVAFAYVTMTGLSANANIFVADRRENLSPVPNAFQPIGVLRAMPDDGLWGTAFLIGECHIATAFHVAFPGHSKPGFVPSPKLKSVFYVGRTHGNLLTGFSARAIATPVKWGAYNTRSFVGLHGDWAILQLDNCLGRSFGAISVFPPIEANNVRTPHVSLAGYPQDRSARPGISFEKNCQIQDYGPNLIFGIDCAVQVGSSGGPVLEKIEGIYYAIGIVIREVRPRPDVLPRYDEHHRNLALLSDQFIAEVRALVERP